MAQDAPLLETPLYALHERLGAKFVPFAGYRMPVQYPMGVLKEHLHTRSAAGLFDVSHMGQAFLMGPHHASVAAFLEMLTPTDVVAIPNASTRYSLFIDDTGGIIDDFMITRPQSPDDDGRLYLVVNASRKMVDFAAIRARMPPGFELNELTDRALLALQGPRAAEVMARLCPKAASLLFMTSTTGDIAGASCHISRSGYTGEDGFEISIPVDAAEAVAEALLAEPEVAPIGLGARDSLRLEAGLCLYGNDIDTTTSPVEANLAWAIGKARRSGGDREGGFPGAERILAELKAGPARRRVGLKPDGRAPMRAGTALYAAEAGDGPAIGHVTSGGFGPSVDAPVAMGYVPSAMATPGTRLFGEVRGKRLPVDVVQLPFVPHAYKR